MGGKARPWVEPHGPLNIEATPVSFPPVGRCIYCDSVDDLSDEHIIPYSMEGNYLLPKSSCEECRRRTAIVENCARTMFGAFRSRFGFQTRRPESRILEVDLFRIGSPAGAAPVARGPAEKYARLTLPFLEPPRVLSGRPLLLGSDPFPLRGSVNIEPQSVPDRDVTLESRNVIAVKPFIRMVAKIGLGISYAYFPDRFRPLVREMILGKSLDPSRYVGGAPEFPIPPTLNSLHFTGWSLLKGRDGVSYLCCHVRLFSGMGAPSYQVLVGDQLLGMNSQESLQAEIDTFEAGGAPFYRFDSDKVVVRGGR